MPLSALNSFGMPLLSGNGMKNLVQAIQEEGLGRMEHLELPDYHFWHQECADFFGALSPSGSGKGKAQSGANGLTPGVRGGPKDGAGLRSLTLLHCGSGGRSDDGDDGEGQSDDDDDGGNGIHFSSLSINFKRQLTQHYPTLERISLVRCGFIRSFHILLLLESCPRLDTLILHEPAISYHRMTCRWKPKVNWIEFAKKDRRQRLIHGNPFLDDEYECSNVTDSDGNDNADEGEQDKRKGYDKDSKSKSAKPSPLLLTTGVNVLRPEIGSPWPCSQFLRVLSLVIRIKDEMPELERIPQHCANIYRRLGQLVVLEDLSVECNTIKTEFDPWSLFSDPDHNDKYCVDSDYEARHVYEVCLDFTLRQGLGYMDKLKRLRRLNIQREGLPRIGKKDRKWMEEHWPRLETVRELALDV